MRSSERVSQKTYELHLVQRKRVPQCGTGRLTQLCADHGVEIEDHNKEE